MSYCPPNLRCDLWKGHWLETPCLFAAILLANALVPTAHASDPECSVSSEGSVLSVRDCSSVSLSATTQDGSVIRVESNGQNNSVSIAVQGARQNGETAQPEQTGREGQSPDLARLKETTLESPDAQHSMTCDDSNAAVTTNQQLNIHRLLVDGIRCYQTRTTRDGACVGVNPHTPCETEK